MTPQASRTILCCSIAGAGLWGVAIGIVTHDSTVSLVGAGLFLVGATWIITAPDDDEEDDE